MLLELLLLLCATFSEGFSSRFLSVCNHQAEPSVAEICSFASPLPLDGLADAVEDAAEEVERRLQQEGGKGHAGVLLRAFWDVTGRAGKALAETKIPLASLVSDGVFTLSTSHHQEYIIESEIKLIQKKPFLQRQLCRLFSLVPDLSSSVPSLLGAMSPCQCWGGGMSLADASLSTSVLSDDGSGSLGDLQDDDWCVIDEPCTGVGDSKDVCMITVDPFRPACALFLVRDDINDTMIDRGGDSYYRFKIPTIQSSEKMKRWIAYYGKVPVVKQLYSLYHSHVSPLLSPIFEAIPLPLYPAMFTLALILLMTEKTIADSHIVQYIITVSFGVLLAGIMLSYVIYRNMQNLHNHLPFASFIPTSITTAMLSFALFATSFSVFDVMSVQLWNFWCYGAFGFPWMGKIYFISSIFIALFLKWYYQVFKEGSNSYRVLRHIVRGISMWIMVNHSSPSIELGCLFAILVLWWDSLGYVAQVEFVGRVLQTPSINYSGRVPLSQAEYERQGQLHTVKALAQLREHLQDNPSLQYDFTDKYGLEGNGERAQLFQRFIRNMYPGKPSESDRERLERDEESDDEEGGNRVWKLLTVLLVCMMAAVTYHPVARYSGFSGDWHSAFSELSNSAASSLQKVLSKVQDL